MNAVKDIQDIVEGLSEYVAVLDRASDYAREGGRVAQAEYLYNKRETYIGVMSRLVGSETARQFVEDARKLPDQQALATAVNNPPMPAVNGVEFPLMGAEEAKLVGKACAIVLTYLKEMGPAPFDDIQARIADAIETEHYGYRMLTAQALRVGRYNDWVAPTDERDDEPWYGATVRGIEQLSIGAETPTDRLGTNDRSPYVV